MSTRLTPETFTVQSTESTQAQWNKHHIRHAGIWGSKKAGSQSTLLPRIIIKVVHIIWTWCCMCPWHAAQGSSSDLVLSLCSAPSQQLYSKRRVLQVGYCRTNYWRFCHAQLKNKFSLRNAHMYTYVKREVWSRTVASTDETTIVPAELV